LTLHSCLALLQSLLLQSTATRSVEIWYKHLGRSNYHQHYHMTSKNLVASMPPIHHVVLDCKVYLCSKQCQEIIPKFSTTVATHRFELVHTDVCSPLPTESLTKHCYILMFIDHCTWYTRVRFLQDKSAVLEKFQSSMAQVKSKFNTSVGAFILTKAGGRGQYTSLAFQKICKVKDINH
jgi:hypothetical protein